MSHKTFEWKRVKVGVRAVGEDKQPWAKKGDKPVMRYEVTVQVGLVKHATSAWGSIEASAQDPIVATSKDYLHYACFREETRDISLASEARREASRERKSLAMRAAWAKRAAEKERVMP